MGLNATLDLDTPHLHKCESRWRRLICFGQSGWTFPRYEKLKGNLPHCFIVLGEMADANNDEIFHKGKKIQEYSLAFKKEVIAYAEARGNQPASKQFSIVEKRVWEWRAQKSNIEGLLGSTKGKQRSRLSGGGRKPLSAKLEELLWEWIENRRGRRLRVSLSL